MSFLNNPNYALFVPYFKKRFTAQDKSFIESTQLNFDIDDEMDAKRNVDDFVEDVTKPLPHSVIISVEKFHEAQLVKRRAKEEERIAAEEAEKNKNLQKSNESSSHSDHTGSSGPT
jgi:hypothetical protein